MRNDLMTEEIEVHPFRARASFRTAEQFAVKGAGFGKIAHGKCKMETGPLWHAEVLVRAKA